MYEFPRDRNRWSHIFTGRRAARKINPAPPASASILGARS